MIGSKMEVNIDWNKERFDSDELDIVEKQGDLFESCQNVLNVDAFDFIEKFMVSDVAREMDNIESKFIKTDMEQLGKILINTVAIEPLKEKKDDKALYWIGYIYRYWAFMGTPSKEIIKIVPVEKAYILYNGYHCIDVQEAISLFIEQNGVTVQALTIAG